MSTTRDTGAERPRETGIVFTTAADAGADHLHIAGNGHHRFADAALGSPKGPALSAPARTVTELPVIATVACTTAQLPDGC